MEQQPQGTLGVVANSMGCRVKVSTSFPPTLSAPCACGPDDGALFKCFSSRMRACENVASDSIPKECSEK